MASPSGLGSWIAQGRIPLQSRWSRAREFIASIALCVLVTPARAEDDVIINEISYHPPTPGDALQFIEIHNRGAAEIDVSGWAFTQGVRFVFPEGTKMAPGSYLVVCRSRAEFTKRYGQLESVLGDFQGRLSHGGERIELSDVKRRVVDAARYFNREPWPAGADGYAATLERVCPRAPSSAPENWAASSWSIDRKGPGTPGKVNENYRPNLPPVVSDVQVTTPPGQAAKVAAVVADPDGIALVTLSFRLIAGGRESEEASAPMARIAGNETRGIYRAEIAAQPEGTLVRFRLRATDVKGMERFHPSENEPRPTYSWYVLPAASSGQVALGALVQVGRVEKSSGKKAGGDEPHNDPRMSRNSAFIQA